MVGVSVFSFPHVDKFSTMSENRYCATLRVVEKSVFYCVICSGYRGGVCSVFCFWFRGRFDKVFGLCCY